MLDHEALIYGSRDEFVASMGPFVRKGIEREDTVLVAARARNLDALREELGPDSARVRMRDAERWCPEPYDRLQAIRQLVDSVSHGAELRAVAEPVWSGSPAVIRQWARYESVLNLALADAPARFVCLYDGSSLPDDILRYASHTHPGQGFVEPQAFDPGPVAAPPPAAIELEVNGSEFRRQLGAHARRLHMSDDRVDDFVLATYEVATNARKHGREPIGARLWTEGDELVCQITDRGPGIADPLAGWLPPPDVLRGRGWGLPIARRLSDALEIGRAGGTTSVHLHFSLEQPVAAAQAA